MVVSLLVVVIRGITYNFEMKYNERLDDLFSRWMESLDETQKPLFCKDGLMLKADKPVEYVDERWDNATRRVMFLLKDKNTPDGDDTRLWLIDEQNGANNRRLSGGKVGKTGFLLNIARMLYGLLELGPDYRITFDEVKRTKRDKVRMIWNTEPFAFIESKKLAGYSWVSSKAVAKAMLKDEAFLNEEIDILRPNIIVCCDADDSQFNYITHNYLAGRETEKIEYDYPDAKMKPCCLWYYPKEHIAVIKSYHPSRIGKADWMIFERVISPFHELVKRGIF